MSQIDLGFLEKCEPSDVQSCSFPSKVGGKPAWLSLENLPRFEALQCPKCNQQLVFFCQVYAPFEEDPKNFHRTIFMFVCRNPDHKDPEIKVFRSSLERENNFYSYDPPADDAYLSFSIEKFVKVCNVCGCFADKQCAKCRHVNYCSREHQMLDWTEGHKTSCNSGSKNATRTYSKKLFSEWELVIEPVEELVEKQVNEEEELKKFYELKKKGLIGTMENTPDSEFEREERELIKKDKVFAKFKKTVEANPEQVIRYNKGAQPLWIAANSLPEDIPSCEYCGSKRQFEFQVMPQMLSLLKESELDWGVLAVYTCSKSCTEGSDYKNEFVFVQNVAS